MTQSITFQSLDKLHHPLLIAWLELYETAFPPEERMLVSAFISILQQKEQGRSPGMQLLAATNPDNDLLGMAFFDISNERRLATLWYMAVNPQMRSQGLGSQIYQEIAHKAKAAGCQALFFEVEMPELAHTPEAQALAERRIRFYQRNGAQLLLGIHYLQSVGWHQPLTPMHIMVQPMQPIIPEAAFALAKAVFEDSLQQTSILSLV